MPRWVRKASREGVDNLVLTSSRCCRRSMLRLRLGARRFCSAAKLTALLPEATVSSAFHQGHRQFCLRHPSEAEDLATLLVAENNKVMHSATTNGLPISVAAPLVAAALEEYDGKVHAFAALPGLCAWVAAMEPQALEDEFGEKAAGAAVAIALGRPRPGPNGLGVAFRAQSRPRRRPLSRQTRPRAPTAPSPPPTRTGPAAPRTRGLCRRTLRALRRRAARRQKLASRFGRSRCA